MSPQQIPPLRGRAVITTVVVIVVLIALCLVLWTFRNTAPVQNILGSTTTTPGAVTTTKPHTTVAYLCQQEKILIAQYYDGAPTVAANGLPIPGGHVVLTLADGSMISVPQTVSGSGTRYANKDESFIFWSKGKTAFVQQGADQTQTYTGCIAESPIGMGGNWSAYASSQYGFSILYPKGYRLETPYTYSSLGPGKKISGVKFDIPVALTTGTNLSQDSGVSVEVLPNATTCTGGLFLDVAKSVKKVTDIGVEYSVATGGGAAAGNLYSETVYAIPGTVPCTAVRYFIHSTQLGNYPPNTVKAFDEAALLVQFDQIRRTLVLGR